MGLLCEFEMVRRPRCPKHHTVKSIVILKGSYFGKAHTIAVEPHDLGQSICRSGYPQLRC